MSNPTEVQVHQSEPVRSGAFVIEEFDIGALYSIPAQRVYAQPIEVINFVEVE